mmetsp:Transcript_4358/g.15103  ORF Transcript_4358/g.15103 Transcript_4358/m.15103 type:complete len:294 (+) Transcript_4358:903-1784(+)
MRWWKRCGSGSPTRSRAAATASIQRRRCPRRLPKPVRCSSARTRQCPRRAWSAILCARRARTLSTFASWTARETRAASSTAITTASGPGLFRTGAASRSRIAGTTSIPSPGTRIAPRRGNVRTTQSCPAWSRKKAPAISSAREASWGALCSRKGTSKCFPRWRISGSRRKRRWTSRASASRGSTRPSRARGRSAARLCCSRRASRPALLRRSEPRARTSSRASRAGTALSLAAGKSSAATPKRASSSVARTRAATVALSAFELVSSPTYLHNLTVRKLGANCAEDVSCLTTAG